MKLKEVEFKKVKCTFCPTTFSKCSQDPQVLSRACETSPPAPAAWPSSLRAVVLPVWSHTNSMSATCEPVRPARSGANPHLLNRSPWAEEEPRKLFKQSLSDCDASLSLGSSVIDSLQGGHRSHHLHQNRDHLGLG